MVEIVNKEKVAAAEAAAQAKVTEAEAKRKAEQTK